MIEEDIYPLIQRLNTPIGPCTIASYAFGIDGQLKVYFDYAKYKRLLDYLHFLFAQATDKDPGRRLFGFFDNPDRFNIRPFYRDAEVGLTIMGKMSHADLPIFCERWDNFFK